MIGIEDIKKMRRAGNHPAYVTLTNSTPDGQGYIQYMPQEVPETADLRLLVGLFVTVEGVDSLTVKRWAVAALKAKAKTVISCVFDDLSRPAWMDHRIQGVDQ